ncbi:pyridoxal phosphate homeostasis protein [Chrysoperla carnea]|uniref:pyridoxal phosphate homeostasis protein n=1 Tax=Chrysoperla carnea TaxID=189513 RepID=UPI001D05CADE|nr:pyridoxal phosphate homeostasis protein [Chrysoperla carnea]
MLRRAMTDVDVKLGLQIIRERIQKACLLREPELQCIEPTLVAVSKTKPVEMLINAYDADQRHFGENYVKELFEKGNDSKILEHCKDIKWHFIGHLQRNKINKVIAVPGLHMIQTIDSEKLAIAVNTAWAKHSPSDQKLKIMLQVNTSQEEEKNGMHPSEVVEVAKNVLEKCPNLELCGLMTIGAYGYDITLGPNPDFLCLIECRKALSKELNIDWKKIHLSMGMSDDFEQAVELGSTIIRVGSSIFGYRPKKTTV